MSIQVALPRPRLHHPSIYAAKMSDKAASPQHARGKSPPSRAKPRSGDRSRSPFRNSGDRGTDDRRSHDDYRSRDNDRHRGPRDQGSDRRGRNDERFSDRRDRNRDSDERPDRDRPRPKKNLGGFKYKEKRRDDEEDRDDNRRGGSYRATEIARLRLADETVTVASPRRLSSQRRSHLKPTPRSRRPALPRHLLPVARR